MVKREVDPKTGGPTALRSLFDYWQSRRDGKATPAGAFDPKGLFTPEEFRWISWVDVRHSDPMDFIFQSHPGFLFGDWSGKAISDYPNQIHARSLALEYLRESKHAVAPALSQGPPSCRTSILVV